MRAYSRPFPERSSVAFKGAVPKDACRSLSAFDSNQWKRSFARCIRDAHEYDNFQQASIADQATPILGYRSRCLPRVSPRALTVTRLDALALGVLGSVGGLRMLHGLNRTSTTNVRVSSDKLKQDQTIEGADISTHTTDDAVSFRLRPTDAHSRRLVPDDQSQPASEGLARIASVQVG